MFTFVLVLVLFAPGSDHYRELVMPFKTKAECEEALVFVREQAVSTEMRFSLSCSAITGGKAI